LKKDGIKIMKEKKGAWKLKYLESLPEQNDANETVEST
jgi:hypothetical protein